MVEIKEEKGEIEISKSHLRHINFYKMCREIGRASCRERV